MKNIDEKEIIKKYVSEGFSVAQIASSLGVSRYKISSILQQNQIARRSISEGVTNAYITRFNKRPFSLKQSLTLRENELKIAAIMLYWGEGAKTGSVVNFANSNPEMIRVFLLFLREICGIDEGRLKVILHLYPDQNQEAVEDFWRVTTGIKAEKFYPSHIHIGKQGTYKTKSPYGTAAINYPDKKLLKTILSWIREYENFFLGMPPA